MNEAQSPSLARAGLAVLLTVFVILQVNYPTLTPQAQLAIFAGLGLLLVFLRNRVHPLFDAASLVATVICFAFIITQTEPAFESLWIGGEPLGNRAGAESTTDHIVGLLGLLLVIEATRRVIGWTLPGVALTFIIYAAVGPEMPQFLFPHRGYDWERIVSQTYLHSQGVFGIALRVMFTYVFLFILFGALLERTGATDFILHFSSRLFKRSRGAPAKVAVLSSGLMGSLSGSAVANTATTGTFTIPLMRSAGFKPALAAGVEAAASSGGALVPPIMGAGAYMMLEIIDPPVTYLQIIQAALIPALLYYGVLLFIVHLESAGISQSDEQTTLSGAKPPAHAGFVFLAAFASLILLLVVGYTPFRAVSVSLLSIVVVGAFHNRTRLSFGDLLAACGRAAGASVPLIAAAGCVGVIIGVVTLTGIGSRLPSVILPLAKDNLILALVLLMVSTIILGMGLPSAVCYLLMATLVGPALHQLGVAPLAAHLFIFYFGMMSMVTPPVALAAYTASAIADSGIMATGLAAFRYALAGFVLPYCFVLNPSLLLLPETGGTSAALLAILTTALGLIPLAQAVTGRFVTRFNLMERLILLSASFSVILVAPATSTALPLASGLAVAATLTAYNVLKARQS